MPKSIEAKSSSFNLKVNLWNADSDSGKVRLTLTTNEVKASKKIDAGKLAKKLDSSEIFGKVSFTVKKSWLKDNGNDLYLVCAYSYKLDIQQCSQNRDNGKSKQTILVRIPEAGDEDQDGDPE